MRKWLAVVPEVVAMAAAMEVSSLNATIDSKSQQSAHLLSHSGVLYKAGPSSWPEALSGC